MNEKQIAFLNAYNESTKLHVGREATAILYPQTPFQFRQNLEMGDRDRSIELNKVMDENATEAFNRENVRGHLKALSAQGQDLSMHLNLNNPDHRQRVETCSLAFSDHKKEWDSANLPLKSKFQAMQLKMNMLASEKMDEEIGVARKNAISRAFAQGIAAAGFTMGPPQAKLAAGLTAMGGAFVDYAFEGPPELKAIVSTELVSLFPEYFISRHCADRLLTEEARALVNKEIKFKVGQVALSHVKKIFPSSPQDANIYQNEEAARRLGNIIGNHPEDRYEFLEEVFWRSTVNGAVSAAKEKQHSHSSEQESAERQVVGFLLMGMGRELSQIKSHLIVSEQHEREQARIQRAKTAAQDLEQLGRALESPILMKIGEIGSMTMKLHASIQQTRQDFAQLAEGSNFSGGSRGLDVVTSCFSFLSGPIGIASAVVSLFSLFRRRRSGSDGLGKALQDISKQIFGMHKEMQSSFEDTWRQLSEIQRHSFEQFQITMEVMRQVVTVVQELAESNERLSNQLRIGFANIEEHLSYIENQELRHVLKEIGRTEWPECQRKHRKYTAVIADPLLAILKHIAGHNVLSGSSLPEIMNELYKNVHESKARFGFYHNLIQKILSDEVKLVDPTYLVEVNSWMKIADTYQNVILKVQSGIAGSCRRDSTVQATYLAEFEDIGKIATANLSFMYNAFENRGKLISIVVDRYKQSLLHIVSFFDEKISAARKTYLQNYGLSESDVFIDLTETFQEGSDRIFSMAKPNLRQSMGVYLPYYCLGKQIDLTPFGQTRTIKAWVDIMKETAQNNPCFHKLITDPRWLLYSEIYKRAYLKIVSIPRGGNISAAIEIYMIIKNVSEHLILGTAYSGWRVHNATFLGKMAKTSGAQLQLIPEKFGIQLNEATELGGELTNPDIMEKALQGMSFELRKTLDDAFNLLVMELKESWYGNGYNLLFLECEIAYWELINVIKFFDPNFEYIHLQENILLNRVRVLTTAFFKNTTPADLKKLQDCILEIKKIIAQNMELDWLFKEKAYSTEEPRETICRFILGSFEHHPLKRGLSQIRENMRCLVEELPHWEESADRSTECSPQPKLSINELSSTENKIVKNEAEIAFFKKELGKLGLYLRRTQLLLEDSGLDEKAKGGLEKTKETIESALKKTEKDIEQLQEKRSELCARLSIVSAGQNTFFAVPVQQMPLVKEMPPVAQNVLNH